MLIKKDRGNGPVDVLATITPVAGAKSHDAKSVGR